MDSILRTASTRDACKVQPLLPHFKLARCPQGPFGEHALKPWDAYLPPVSIAGNAIRGNRTNTSHASVTKR